MKPNWVDAPEWAQWLAQDEDGWWWWFESEPKLRSGGGFGCWWSWDRMLPVSGKEEPGPNWRSTLEARPCTPNT